MRTANLLLAFGLELAMLAAWAWSAASLPLPSPFPVLASILAPLLVIGCWGLWAAPRAPYRLRLSGVVALKTTLLGGGAAGLIAAGQPFWGWLDAGLIAFHMILALAWGQMGPIDSAAGLVRKLTGLLKHYLRSFPEEGETVRRFLEFAQSGEVLQGKTNLRRHITASAWVVNADRTKVLLTHHAKLNLWVQLGGHTDPGEDWAEAALREAEEESGLQPLRLVSPQLFDLDVHEIPARLDQGAHWHYDLRFLVEADDTAPLVMSDESHDLRWIHLDDLESLTTEPSQLRMRRKTPGVTL